MVRRTAMAKMIAMAGMVMSTMVTVIVSVSDGDGGCDCDSVCK